MARKVAALPSQRRYGGCTHAKNCRAKGALQENAILQENSTILQENYLPKQCDESSCQTRTDKIARSLAILQAIC